jgi:hypothetical protein
MDEVQGYWATISELAHQWGVDRSAISCRVSRYEALGLLKSSPGKRGSKLVNVAELDRIANEATDSARGLIGTASSALPRRRPAPCGRGLREATAFGSQRHRFLSARRGLDVAPLMH